jgi:MFS family permease
MKPTRIRVLVVFVAMLAAVLLYLERVCLSVAEVFIREDLHLDKPQMGWVFGAFFFAYALGQVPAGWLSQRYGPRAMLAVYMLGWSVFGCFIALAQDFWTLFLARFLLGLSQAGAYPTAALLVKRWVPDRSRGIANSVIAFGGRFGGAGANWLTGLLIVAFVPMSTPALLTERDLLEVGAIRSPTAEQLKAQSATPALQRVRDDIRRRYDAEHPVDSLNDWMKHDRYPEGLDWENVGLASDGRGIVNRIPALAPLQEELRLKRLVLERAFPGAVRQLHTDGWRPTLLIYGTLGIVVGILFFFVTRNWPREHPWVNEAERKLIEEGQSDFRSPVSTSEIQDADFRSRSRTSEVGIPWGLLIRSRNQWMFSINQFFSNMGWVFLITLMPRFLSERFSVSVEDRGLMTTIPLFVASFATLAGGWATDRWSRKFGNRWGRALPMGLAKLPCVIALLACPFLPTAWAVVLALTVMAVFQDFGLPAVWAFSQDTGGKQVGAVLGWANMWGNFGGGVAQITMGLAAARWGWDGVLYCGAAAFAICGIAGMLTNAEEELFEERGDSVPL